MSFLDPNHFDGGQMFRQMEVSRTMAGRKGFLGTKARMEQG